MKKTHEWIAPRNYELNKPPHAKYTFGMNWRAKGGKRVGTAGTRPKYKSKAKITLPSITLPSLKWEK